MIKQGSINIKKFFESGVYQPLTMQEPIQVPWDTEEDTMVLTSHTSLMTEHMLRMELFPEEK